MSTFTGTGAAKAFAPENPAKTAAKAPKTKRLGFTFIDRSSLEYRCDSDPSD
jgi:hypothetical protein